MKILLSILILMLYVNIPVNSAAIYVNGVIGNDKNDGISNDSAHALLTIQKAVDLASPGDEIKVIGKYKNNSITYIGGVYVERSKHNLKFIGEEQPTIDAIDKNKNTIKNKNTCLNGFEIYPNSITVKGFIIKNFASITDKTDYKVSGAGIFTVDRSGKNTFEDNIVDNCTWGLFLNGTILTEINNNEIINIKQYSDKDTSFGGTAIIIVPSAPGIEENQIGTKVANKILNIDGFGIYIGNPDKNFIAENLKIQNNSFEKTKKAAIAIVNLVGIIDITKNTFSSNECSIKIEGMPIDCWIGENIFIGSKGFTEIEANSKYDGALLYDIWKNNNNIFKSPTYAAVNKRLNQILLIGDKYNIRTSEKKAAEDAGEIGKVDTVPISK